MEIAVIVLFQSIIIFLLYVKKKKSTALFYISILFLFILLYFQYTTTYTKTDFRSLTVIEQVDQARHVNEYPMVFRRLAYIMELRKEVIAFFKIESNFINIFDLQRYFAPLHMAIMLPFIVAGLFKMIQMNIKLFSVFTLPAIALISIIGHENKFGSLSLAPILLTSIWIYLFNIFKIKRFGND